MPVIAHRSKESNTKLGNIVVQAHFSEAAHSEHCVLTTWTVSFTRYSQCVSLIAWPTSHFMAFGARKFVKEETKEEDFPTISPRYYAGFTASPCPMLHDIRRKQHHAHALPFVVRTGSRFHPHSKWTKFRGYKFCYCFKWARLRAQEWHL